MKIWVFLLFAMFSISESLAQGKELSFIPGGGYTYFLGPGGKPDKAYNYGVYVQYYFKSDKVSFGVESGCIIIREITLYNQQLSAILQKESSFSMEPIVPVFINTKIRNASGWFLEAGLGTYLSEFVRLDLAAKIGAGYSYRLNEHLSIPLLVRFDFFQDRKSYDKFWDGMFNASFNVGIAYHFKH